MPAGAVSIMLLAGVIKIGGDSEAAQPATSRLSGSILLLTRSSSTRNWSSFTAVVRCRVIRHGRNRVPRREQAAVLSVTSVLDGRQRRRRGAHSLPTSA